VIDCIVIGPNVPPTAEHVEMVRAVDSTGGAWRDLRLAFALQGGEPHTPLDLLNRYHAEAQTGEPRFHNLDFPWPTVPYLADYLRRRGFTAEGINLFRPERDALAARLRAGPVRTVAVTTTLYVSPQPILEIVRFVRDHSNAAIVIGGPYVAGQAEALDEAALGDLFAYLGGDAYVISPEGEAALAGYLTALRDGTDPTAVPNLAFRRGGAFVRTPAKREDNDLAAERIDYTRLPETARGPFISLRTAKSCPFACAFCGFPRRAGKYTVLPPDAVEAELDAIAALGRVTTLTFLDDSFNVPKARFREILRRMIARDYDFRWNSFYRSDHGDAEIIALMREAGCEGVFLGIESGSDAMLERMQKTSRRQHYLDAIPRLQTAGISCHASLIVGFPGETEATVRESADLIEAARPDYFRAQLWYCDPLTPVWRDRARYGLSGAGFHWRHDTMDSAEAADHVDRFFFRTAGATWLPQHGFEQWSLFYLQRRGYAPDRVRDFVRCFNAAVRAQIADPSQTDLPTPLDDALRALALGGEAPADLLRAIAPGAPATDAVLEDDAAQDFAF